VGFEKTLSSEKLGISVKASNVGIYKSRKVDSQGFVYVTSMATFITFPLANVKVTLRSYATCEETVFQNFALVIQKKALSLKGTNNTLISVKFHRR
jgi:hypothetical protein